MRSVWTIALVAGLGLVLAGCGDSGQARVEGKKPQIERPGAAEKSDLGVTVTKPDDWYQMSDQDTGRLMQRGMEVAAGDDKVMARAMDASRARTLALFAVLQFPPGAPVPFNPSLLGNAENISELPGIKRGADYFFHVKRTLSMSGLAYEIVSEPAPYTIDGQSFDRAELRMEVNGTTVEQAIYLARHGDYMVSIVQSWSGDDQRATTQAVLDGIKLDW